MRYKFLFLITIVMILVPVCGFTQQVMVWNYTNDDSPMANYGKFALTDSRNTFYSVIRNGSIFKFTPGGDTAWVFFDSLGIEPEDAIIDHNDNIILAGYTFFPDNLLYITKIDTSGSIIWRLQIDVPNGNRERIKALDIDSENNIYITGFSGNQWPGGNYYTAKISHNGLLLWDTEFGGVAYNYLHGGRDIAVKDSNNIYSVGDFGGSYTNIKLVKYNYLGDTIWTREFDYDPYVPGSTPITNISKKMGLDSIGNIYVLMQAQEAYISLVVKYSPTGVFLWVQPMDTTFSPPTTYYEDMLVDSTGIYVAGYESWSGDEWAGIVKLNTAGNQVYKTVYTTLNLRGTTIARHEDGVLLIATKANCVTCASKFYTLRFDAAGFFDWIHMTPNSFSYYDDVPLDIAVDNMGGIYVTGYGQSSSNEHRSLKLIDCGIISSPPIINSSASNNAICAGQTTKLYQTGATIIPPIHLKWYKDFCGGSNNLVGVGDSIFIAPTQTTTYYARLEGICNPGACASITISVNPSPTVQILNQSPIEICQGDTVILLSSSSVGSTFQWKRNGVSIPNATQDFYTTTQSGKYTIVATNGIGCSTNSAFARIKIICLPISDPNEKHIISDLENELKVFPNPHNGKFQCVFKNRASGIFSIINPLGQILFNRQCEPSTHNIDLDLSDYVGGVYLIRFISQTESYTLSTILIK